MLVVVDEFTRNCLSIEVARSITASNVISTLQYFFWCVKQRIIFAVITGRSLWLKKSAGGWLHRTFRRYTLSQAVPGKTDTVSLLSADSDMSCLTGNCSVVSKRRRGLWKIGDWSTITNGRIVLWITRPRLLLPPPVLFRLRLSNKQQKR